MLLTLAQFIACLQYNYLSNIPEYTSGMRHSDTIREHLLYLNKINIHKKYLDKNICTLDSNSVF